MPRWKLINSPTYRHGRFNVPHWHPFHHNGIGHSHEKRSHGPSDPESARIHFFTVAAYEQRRREQS